MEMQHRMEDCHGSQVMEEEVLVVTTRTTGLQKHKLRQEEYIRNCCNIGSDLDLDLDLQDS